MKILIADGKPESRARIKRAIGESGALEAVWEAADGEQAVQLSRQLHPDLVLIDLAMPRINGLESTRLIKEKQPEVRVIVLSSVCDRIYQRAAIRSGADGFFPKAGKSVGLAVLKYVSSPSRPVRLGAGLESEAVGRPKSPGAGRQRIG